MTRRRREASGRGSVAAGGAVARGMAWKVMTVVSVRDARGGWCDARHTFSTIRPREDAASRAPTALAASIRG